MTSLKIVALLLLYFAGGELSAADSATSNAATQTAQARGRIVILGDSITAGYGVDPAQAYPALLQKKIDAAGLPFEVVNAGVSGDTTAGGLRRVDWILSKGADVLIVALGGNDGLRGVPPKQTEANLNAIVKRARAKIPGLAVIVAGMEMPANFGRDFVEQYRAVFPRVAAENNAALIPFLLEKVGGMEKLNQPDRIHPNAEGHKRVAENVWPVLQKVLAALKR